MPGSTSFTPEEESLLHHQLKHPAAPPPMNPVGGRQWFPRVVRRPIWRADIR